MGVWEQVGLKVGLEIHRQLQTHKLFCSCESVLTETDHWTFSRHLRPTRSELGSIDQAASEEAKLKREFTYQATPDICLVEMDEEPPHPVNQEAVDITLTIARLLGSIPVDELSFMRKIVIDGSNTTGFQRTGLMAFGGKVDTPQGPVRVSTLCLEEDAARIVETDHSTATYRLDRIGIPEVELATEPDIHTPEQAKEAARALGDLLRATRKVRRGLGTIRQDVNVSIAGGKRVEIKLVQDLNSIPLIVEEEARRQYRLIHVAKELETRGITKEEVLAHKDNIIDLTEDLSNTSSKVLQRALNNNGIILGVKLDGFAGLMGQKGGGSPVEGAPESWLYDGKRLLGPEIADYAKVKGVKGLFHSDELPAYGVTPAEVDMVKGLLSCTHDDGFVLVAESPDIATAAMDAVIERSAMAVDGVVAEVRKPLPDNSTQYLRPMPGAARMYPETDLKPLELDRDRAAQIDGDLPELFGAKVVRYVSEFGLSQESANQLVFSSDFEMFEDLSKDHDPKVVTTTILSWTSEAANEGANTDHLTTDTLDVVLTALDESKFAKEAVPNVLVGLCKKMDEDPTDPTQALEATINELGLETVDDSEIIAVIDEELQKRLDFVKEQGMRAIGPLMGPVMGRLRGKADGKKISQLLKQRISELT